MKRVLALIASVLLIGSFVFAKDSVLIDFTLLDADIMPDKSGKATENGRTLMDYSYAADETYSADAKALMKTSFELNNWDCDLNSSAQTKATVAGSKVKPVKVSTKSETSFAGKNVMGVHAIFPTWSTNVYMRVTPPYEIQAYEPLRDISNDGVRKEQTAEQKGKYLFEDGYGLVKNVGTIKSISVYTMGMNQKFQLYVLLKDNDNVERRYLVGSLYFDGWKTLQWNNPDYFDDIRARELRIYPIYPRGVPFIKFCGFQITRDADCKDVEYTGYFQSVKLTYDVALLHSDRDIDDEDEWGVITKRETDRQTFEMSKFAAKQAVKFMEAERIKQEESVDSSLKQ